MLSGRVTDKMVFVAIYTIVAVLVIIQGARHVANLALDTTFYNDYLVVWEVQLLTLRHQTTAWPDLNPHDPGAYMEALESVMRAGGHEPPMSNTDRAHIYRLRQFGEQPKQVLFVGTNEQMIIYNLPVSTFERLDHFIDGGVDPDQGRFTGRWSEDRITRIAYWKI